MLSSDTKKFTLTSDPNTVKAADWLASLRTNEDVAPLPGEAKGLGFANGNVALSGLCICSLPYTLKSVSNKFKFDLVLFPLGPTGMRGYEAFVTTFAMYAQTKHVAEAFDLLTFMTSPDTAKISPAYAHIAAWMGDGKNKGPFPMPYNFHPLLRRHGAQRVHLSPTHHHLHHRRPPRAAPPPGYPIPSEMAIAVASDPLDGPSVVLPEGDGQWAQSDAEHAVIASERSFMAWSVGEIMEAEAALDHAEALIPSPEVALAGEGAQRQCLIVAHVSVIAYRVLLVRHAVGDGMLSAREGIAHLRRLLERHAAFEQAEAEDERRRGISRTLRRNYPSWWDEGRTQPRYHYWRSLCWLALANLAAVSVPEQQQAWLEHARSDAAAAYRGYAQRARLDNRERLRAWYALLLQAEVERVAGAMPEALRMIEAAAMEAGRYRRPDAALLIWLRLAQLWRETALPGWERHAERALRTAWRLAGEQADTGRDTIRQMGQRLFGTGWLPVPAPRHRPW